MYRLKYIKIFELFHPEDIKREIIFSMSEEDMSDLLLPFTDNGFKVEISPMYINDDYFELGDQEIRNKLSSNEVSGSYNINLEKNLYSDDDHRFGDGNSQPRRLSYKSDYINIIQFVLKEVSQISKRVEYVEWEINRDDNVLRISLFIVCPKNPEVGSKKRMFLKNEYDVALLNKKEAYLTSILKNIRGNLTPVFNRMSTGPWYSSAQNYIESGKMFVFVKDVNKAMFTLNKNKLDKKTFYINNRANSVDFSVELKKLEEFKLGNPNVEIKDDIKNIIEISFDYTKLLRLCKDSIKIEFRR